MLYLVLALCVMGTVEAKAFQANDGMYNGDYDHIYQNMYESEYPEKPQPPPNDPNFELRYIPHVDGQPIFIPPVEPVHYQTAVPISPHRRKTRPKYGYTKNPDWTSQKKMLDGHSDGDSEISKDPPIPEQEVFAEKPYGEEIKHKQKTKKAPNKKYNQKMYSNKVKSHYNEEKDHKDKIVEKKSYYPVHDVKIVDVPLVHAKSINPEDYDLPTLELDTSNEAEYEDPQFPEEIDGFMNDQVEYDFDHPEIVDAALNSKPNIENGFDDGEQIEVAPLSHFQSDGVSKLENESDYDYSSDEVEALSKQKNKKEKHDYPSSVVIKEQKNKAGPETVIKTPVKFPSVHMSDYVYEASKKTPPKSIKPVKHSIKVAPKKPHVPKIDKDLIYEDALVKPESVKIVKKPNIHPKPVQHKPIKNREHVDSDLVDDLSESDLDNEEYDTPVDKIDESRDEEFDDPLVVEALVKKDPVDQEEYHPDYDSPKVVEALTKKKPSEKDGYKEIKNSNGKVVYKHDKQKVKGNTKDKQKVVKVGAKDDHKKPDLDYNDPDKVSPLIDLRHQRESPIFLDLNQNDIEEKEVLSEEFADPENDPENINKNDPLDTGSGLNNGGSEDARSLFLKSNVWSLMSNFHTQERNKFKTCKTPNNEPGNCMPIQMCPVPNLDLTLDDLMKKICTIENVFIGICCPEFPAVTLKVKWDNLTDSSTDVKEKNMETKECGEMQGSVDNLHSWPWMTPLISASTRRIFCGGVLIKDQYVLTAAHCTNKIPHNQILAILGPMSSKQDPTNQEFAVIEIKRHAQYNARTMQNDIALLKLSKPVVLNEFRRFICLPEDEANFVNKEALLLGWQGSFEASKNEESLRVISPEQCRKGVKMVIGKNVLCTEPRTEDIMCNLDSGAPLVVKEDGKFTVIGILSWNRNDCDSDFPAIFTRVSHFRKWIDNHAT